MNDPFNPHFAIRNPRLLFHAFAFLPGYGRASEGIGGVDIPPAGSATGVDPYDPSPTAGGPTVETPTMQSTPPENIPAAPAPPMPQQIPAGPGAGPPPAIGPGPAAPAPGLTSGNPGIGALPGGLFNTGGNPNQGPLSLYARLGRRSVPGTAVPGRLPIPPQRANPYLIAQLAQALGNRGAARPGMAPT